MPYATGRAACRGRRLLRLGRQIPSPAAHMAWQRDEERRGGRDGTGGAGRTVARAPRADECGDDDEVPSRPYIDMALYSYGLVITN